ncbi:VCBS repeat-containing protein [Cyclobacterium jeungdonense]|uniref:VCBS repeat-containing protein n=1 Tax=Cyclobacterium jeungdonense TaxID=708087 RepID=A0ABT8C4S0_9BACT|nr:VCBS repeat-containing protein [Cyclobacterium jeungdonense]MDN3687788.1 VCBS repeat-containing protein [Cyclobacterium jeungdonense]
MSRQYRFLYWILVLFLGTSCKPENPDAVFTELKSRKTGIDFKNLVRESDAFNVLTYGYFYQGGGVAVGDINEDGLPDIYFTGNMMASKLYLNQGNFEFEDITASAGVAAAGLWNTGTTMADVNGDGLLDIYVCRSAANDPNNRRNLLFINQGDLTFREVAADFGLDDPGYSTQASFFDYDNDGDLDLFLLNHSTQEYAGFSRIDGSFKRKTGEYLGDKLYRNDEGIFVNVTKESGIIDNVLGFGLAVTVSDLNDDGWLDIYVSNDYNEEDYLYYNQQDGTFKERIREHMGHVSLFSMGADAADLNNDLLPDVLTMDMMPEFNFNQKSMLGPENYDKYRELLNKGFHAQSMRNMLQLNQGDGQFVELGHYAGIAHTDWSWAVLAADFDNDGWKDIFISNGYARNYLDMDFLNYMVSERIKTNQTGKEEALIELIDKMPPIYVQNYLYQNQGDLTFINRAGDWGLHQETVSNAAAYADLDGDGDLDLIVCHTNDPVSIYRNNSERLFENAFLKVKLEGDNQNTSGIGAKVRVYAGDIHWQQEMIPTRGYQSSVDHELVFGLGHTDQIDSLEVWWPGGGYQVLRDLAVNQTIQLDQEASKEATFVVDETSEVLFEELEDALGLDFVHRESSFLDFSQDRLMPNTMGSIGPKMAAADVNGDGLQDLFIGGGKNQAGKLFIQNNTGRFYESPQPALQADSLSIDTDAVWLDANADGSPDLYVVSGGADFPESNPAYQDRLYLNDGKGLLVRDKGALPEMRVSGSAVAIADINGDGLEDLFVGGRYLPGKYPEPPRSFLLLNDGNGQFMDATLDYNRDLLAPGLVSAVQFADTDGDGHLELILIGEWMGIRIYKNQNGSLELISGEMTEQTKGWWLHLSVLDLDEDGDLDIVAGNYGQNTVYQADRNHPLQVVFKDFDNNGRVDPLLTYYKADTNSFAFSRDELIGQLPMMKGEFADYRSFAKASVAEIFAKLELADADTLLTHQLQSLLLENDGKGQFTIQPLPAAAQFSPLYAAETGRLPGKGKPILLTGGNLSKTRVSTGRLDSNPGFIFVMEESGAWQVLPQAKTGLHIPGEVRDIKELEVQGKKYYVFAQNDGKLRVFKAKD